MKRIRFVAMIALATAWAATLSGQDVDALMQKAQEEIAAQNWPAAEAQLHLLLQGDETYAPAYYELSKLGLLGDDLIGAQDHIDTAIEHDPRNIDYREQADNIARLSAKMSDARRAYGARDYLDAVNTYEEVVETHPTFASAYFGLGMAFTKAEMLRDAAEAFRQAQGYNPSDPRYGAALRNLVADRYNAGNRIFRARDWEGASLIYREAIDLDPNFHQAYYRLAKTEELMGDNEGALATLDRGLAIMPDYIILYVAKGNILRREGSYIEAEAVFRQAVAVDENADKAWVGLGSVLRRSDAPAAIAAFLSAVAANPGNGNAAEHLGEIYSEEENWEVARQYLEQAVKLKSKDHITAWRLAHVYNALGNYDQARLSAKRSTDLKKSFEYGWFEKGLAEQALGNRQAAIVAFREAIKGRDAGIRKSAEYELKSLESN